MSADGDWQVTRRVPLAEVPDPALLSSLVPALEDRSEAVLAVHCRPGARHLTVRYDASRTHYRDLCRQLAELGVPCRSGRWPRLLAAWYGWQDDNLRAGAARPEGACCNRPPRRPR